jgi:hypothetical protein
VPGSRPGVATWEEAVVAAELHREPQPAFVGAIWECGGDVVEGREPRFGTDEAERVVLGVGVGAGDQPAPRERVGEMTDGALPRRTATRCAAVARSRPDRGRVDSGTCAWADAKRLAEVLLMDAAGRLAGGDAVRVTTSAVSSPNRSMRLRAAIKPARRAASRQTCSLRSWSSRHAIAGLRMCVVGWRRRGRPSGRRDAAARSSPVRRRA